MESSRHLSNWQGSQTSTKIATHLSALWKKSPSNAFQNQRLVKKGKPTPDPTLQKVTRNEEKLTQAFQSHETGAGRLVVLMEQAVTFGWNDLYPLVKHTMRWQINRVAREQETYGQLPWTLQAMKSTVKEQQQHDV